MATMKVGLRYASEIDMPQAEATTIQELQSIVDFLVSLVPSNPFAAASAGAILPLIVFTALVAAGVVCGRNQARSVSARHHWWGFGCGFNNEYRCCYSGNT